MHRDDRPMSDSQTSLFQEIYAQHLGIVWKTARAFAFSKQDQDDLVQEILISLWEAAPKFAARSKLSTYVYRIAHRQALNWKRGHRRYSNKLAVFERQGDHALDQPDPQTEARLQWIYRSLTKLAPLDRTICLLYLDGLPQSEIADIVGMTESAVGVRIHRCKQQLITLLEKDHEGL